MATSVIGRLVLRRVCTAVNSSRAGNAWHQARTFCVTSKLFADRYFTKKHEWVDVDSGTGKVGITDYAQDKLGDVVYIQLPEVGKELEIDEEAGVLESVKAASEVYTPLSGEITEVNLAVEGEPSLINNSPFDEGWMFKIKLSKPDELEALLDEKAYKKYCETLE